MESLIELTQVVNRNKVKSLRTLDSKEKDTPTDFYHRILEGEFKSEEEASQFYFGENSNHPKYRRLRNRLKDRLRNSIIFIDVNDPKFSDSQRAQFTCQKNLVIIRLLLARNARLSALELLRKTLKYSKKYELSEVTVELLRILKSHHALKTGNKNKFQKCLEELQQYENALNAENTARNYFDLLALELVKKTRASEEYFETAEKAIHHLNKLDINSYRFIFFKASITSNYYLHKREYRNLINTTSETNELLKRKNNVSNIVTGHFLFLRLIALTQLMDYKNGEACFKECIAHFESGSVRWYNTHDIFFLLLCRTKKYSQLDNLYQIVTNHPSFNKQTNKRKETWRTYEAFLYYLSIIDQIPIHERTMSDSFRVNKFLNNVPSFSMDKAGYNIPVLIIQILILITQKKYDQLNDKIEAIEKYSSRYLRKDNNFRSNCFIKMLMQVPKRNFHRKAVERHSIQYLKKLESVSLTKAEQSFEIEIIPYETLWEYVLESLDNRFH